MFEIRPIADKHEQEALAARCRLPYEKDSLAYAVFRNGTPAAICQFRCPRPDHENSTATLLSLGCVEGTATDSGDLLHLLTVGVMAFCVQNGCARLLLADSVPKSTAKEVAFLYPKQ